VTPVTGALSYVWTVNNGAIVTFNGTNATINFTPVTSTSVNLQVNANNACGASSPLRQTIAVNLLCRENTIDAIQSLTVYPNPTNGKVSVDFQGEEDVRYAVIVNDLLGNQVLSRLITAGAGTNSTTLDLSSVAKGVYLVVAQREDGTDQQTIRLIVQ
jgi:uncharacterized protein